MLVAEYRIKVASLVVSIRRGWLRVVMNLGLGYELERERLFLQC